MNTGLTFSQRHSSTKASINLINLLKFSKTVFLLILKSVVYCIKCKDCAAICIGQTKRQLKTKIKKHKKNILRDINQLSVISKHRLHLGYDWDRTILLDNEMFFYKRLISKCLHIKLNTDSIIIRHGPSLSLSLSQFCLLSYHT